MEWLFCEPGTARVARTCGFSHPRATSWCGQKNGEVEASVSGQVRRNGCNVAGSRRLGRTAADAPVIEQVFERRTVLSRKHPGRAMDEQVLATNIDALFIVSGLDGDYNERRIERYLVVARQSGARPVILLNKADLAEQYGIDVDAIVARLHDWSGAPVLASARGRRRP